MNIGIDLGTTNSALAYIPEIHGELPDYPEIHVLAIPQYVAPGQMEARRTLPSFLFLGDQTTSASTRASRARWCRPSRFIRPNLAIESRSGSHRQDSSVGRAGRRARAFAGGSFHGDSVEPFAMRGIRRIRTRRWHRKTWC